MKNIWKKLMLLCALTLVAGVARAEVRTKPITYAAGAVQMQGFLAYDDAAQGARPGVIVVPEWWGLTDYAKNRARQLAQLGYVAFAIDMYGNGKTTDDPAEAGKLAGALKSDRTTARARARAGLDVLKSQKNVDPSRIAAIGYCFCGTVALEMARDAMPLRGVVAFHAGLATDMPAKKGAVRAKVLVCHGADDAFEPPEEIAAFQKEMRDAGVDWQFIAYGGAVHSFTNPDADKKNIPGIRYNAAADHRSWEAMKVFFGEVMK
jgi:dienelactone hydrolase